MKKPHKGFEIQEFCRRLNCFEASDLVLFFDKVRGRKQKFKDWDQDYYVHDRTLTFTKSPMQFVMGLDSDRAEQFYNFIMYDWQGNWEEVFEKQKEKLIEAKGMTKDILDAVGLGDVKKEDIGSFMDKLEKIK